ncbi:hypothetical protein NUSPORA_01655 [Nucleospora cyclopteri]
MKKNIDQEDRYCILLFVLCMDILTLKLNGRYLKVNVQTDNEYYTSTHLLFIDDLKLFAATMKTYLQ